MSQHLIVIGPLTARILLRATVLLAGLIGALLGAGMGMDAADRTAARDRAADIPRQWL